MATFELVRHPSSPVGCIKSVRFRWFEPDNGTILLRWLVEGAHDLVIPPFAGSRRADELWKTTCFELFLKDQAGLGYGEMNFSPSNFWAAYRFSDYRKDMQNMPMAFDPVMSHEIGSTIFAFNSTIRKDVLKGTGQIGICAVLEEKNAGISYWSLAHPNGPADFHDPACFALPLAAPLSL